MHDPELLKLRLLRLDEKIVELLAERLAAARWLLEAESSGEHRESLDPSTISVLLAERAREHGLDPLILRSVYDALLSPIGGGHLDDGAPPQPPPVEDEAVPQAGAATLPPVQGTPCAPAERPLTDLLPSAHEANRDSRDGPDSLMDRMNFL
ncbi:chorismate mutase [Futiania mangrovi]|uniref:Chorismate mutase n=1 Tax=Futiania mangrovi TaxID=2959716 RepID=A0A9J6P7U6_9PROT|nr:chorismate mutase [Futiania mangrovii]MCP1335220.1 chorismate mutase [Futiania mangrovii]